MDTNLSASGILCNQEKIRASARSVEGLPKKGGLWSKSPPTAMHKLNLDCALAASVMLKRKSSLLHLRGLTTSKGDLGGLYPYSRDCIPVERGLRTIENQ